MYDQEVKEKEGRRDIAPRAWSGLASRIMPDLEEEARAGPDLEAYRELVRTPTCRLGLTAGLVAADKVRFLLVVLVDRSPRSASIEGALARRGYSAMRLDEGWIAHERAVSRRRLGAELRILRDIVLTPGGSP